MQVIFCLISRFRLEPAIRLLSPLSAALRSHDKEFSPEIKPKSFLETKLSIRLPNHSTILENPEMIWLVNSEMSHVSQLMNLNAF